MKIEKMMMTADYGKGRKVKLSVESGRPKVNIATFGFNDEEQKLLQHPDSEAALANYMMALAMQFFLTPVEHGAKQAAKEKKCVSLVMAEFNNRGMFLLGIAHNIINEYKNLLVRADSESNCRCKHEERRKKTTKKVPGKQDKKNMCQ